MAGRVRRLACIVQGDTTIYHPIGYAGTRTSPFVDVGKATFVDLATRRSSSVTLPLLLDEKFVQEPGVFALAREREICLRGLTLRKRRRLQASSCHLYRPHCVCLAALRNPFLLHKFQKHLDHTYILERPKQSAAAYRQVERGISELFLLRLLCRVLFHFSAR
jgi:hypothetical protein